MKLADKIKECLLSFVVVGGYDIAIPNFFYGMWEMDVFLLRPSGHVYEYEIKISKSDFKADFNKNCGGKLKHDNISAGTGRCNRFYFVVPDSLIAIEDCPKHAGLIYFTDGKYGRLNIVKAAPLLHKNKCKIDYIGISQRLAFRERHWAKKYHYERHEVKELKSKIKRIIEENPGIINIQLLKYCL